MVMTRAMRREDKAAVLAAAKIAKPLFEFNYSNLAAFRTWIAPRGNKKVTKCIYRGFKDIRQAGFKIWFAVLVGYCAMQ